jgi:hypothetical protein
MQPPLLLLKVFMSLRLPLEISCLRAREVIVRQVMRSATRKSSRKTKMLKAQNQLTQHTVTISPGWIRFLLWKSKIITMVWLNYIFLLTICMYEQKSKSKLQKSDFY